MGRHGISCFACFDTRNPEARREPLPAIRKVVRDHIVQGIIGTAVSKESVPWLMGLGMPVALLTEATDIPCTVGLDYGRMIQLAVGRLAEQGCRRVGLVTHVPRRGGETGPGGPVTTPFHAAFRAEVEQAGLAYGERWIAAPDTVAPSGRLEHFGFDAFTQLWQTPGPHPDGLFVYPDVVGRGVFHAIRQSDVQVPEQLKLVVHRNREFDIVNPVPVSWVEVSIHDFAAALMTVVERQRGGETPARILVPLRLQVSGGRPGGGATSPAVAAPGSASADDVRFARLIGLDGAEPDL
jgi:DNA-binding LacI/PurR family transcriptional regulator